MEDISIHTYNRETYVVSCIVQTVKGVLQVMALFWAIDSIQYMCICEAVMQYYQCKGQWLIVG